jgi:hypothetical protein
MTTENRVEKPIIFFDGVCGMCNAFVDLILRFDQEQTFLFAPLQGSTARDLLPPLTGDAREWSMVYADEAGIMTNPMRLWKSIEGLAVSGGCSVCCAIFHVSSQPGVSCHCS